MSREDTKEARINTLKQTQKQRQEDSRRRVFEAIKRLQGRNAKISFPAVAHESGLSVTYLYKYPDIKFSFRTSVCSW